MENLKNEKFIERASKVHNGRFDYSMVEYINNETKVKIICPIHGVFEQEPRKHINRTQICPKCTGHYTDSKLFIEKAMLKHGDEYDYSLVKYVNAKSKVKIICPIHGVFEQSPNGHLRGSKCYLCTGTPKKSTKTFIDEAHSIHGDRYDYSLVNYEINNVKVGIICSKHGIFKQTPASHLSGSGCPKCKESKGEKIITEILREKGVSFTPQKRFPDCRNILPLPFDFYLPNDNLCIEFQGRQHFKAISIFGGKKEFNKRKVNDEIKVKYCKDNKIKLLLINHDDDIKEYLNSI